MEIKYKDGSTLFLSLLPDEQRVLRWLSSADEDDFFLGILNSLFASKSGGDELISDIVAVETPIPERDNEKITQYFSPGSPKRNRWQEFGDEYLCSYSEDSPRGWEQIGRFRFKHFKKDRKEIRNFCSTMANRKNLLINRLAKLIQLLHATALRQVAKKFNPSEFLHGDSWGVALLGSNRSKLDLVSLKGIEFPLYWEDEKIPAVEDSKETWEYRVRTLVELGLVELICIPQQLVLYSIIGSSSDPHNLSDMNASRKGVTDSYTGQVLPSGRGKWLCEKLRSKLSPSE
jgi:hypothetical protein